MAIATMFSAVAAAVSPSGLSRDGDDLTLGRAVLAYYASAGVGGTLVWLSLRNIAGRLGELVATVLACATTSFAVGIAVNGSPSRWTPTHRSAAVFVFAVLCLAVIRETAKESKP